MTCSTSSVATTRQSIIVKKSSTAFTLIADPVAWSWHFTSHACLPSSNRKEYFATLGTKIEMSRQQLWHRDVCCLVGRETPLLNVLQFVILCWHWPSRNAKECRQNVAYVAYCGLNIEVPNESAIILRLSNWPLWKAALCVATLMGQCEIRGDHYELSVPSQVLM